ncbi:type VI secretion system protein [Archangium lansingense]|uniref:Type VI secretion system protein n=1 Tax=Archangium lansingense TaxID=2995310 RepID=A0ABT4AEN2_9BACT|nr:type VI secretion system protein [Archangium lansinium]MCY1080021.1 type VI secretion system protein [Archangium lansinium]
MNATPSPLDTALHRLGATGRQRDRRYQVPWIMLVGEPSSGRTSLMAGTNLRRPYGSPTRREMEAEGWGVWLFDQGLVLDMPGMTEVPTDEWQALLQHLKGIRGQRPIDGLMLTVPATELTGPTALDDVKLDRKAQGIFERLQSLRAELGVRVPISVIITQADHLPGFAAFCRTLPPRMRDEMLGWSSPYSHEEPYAPAWVDEACESIHQELSRMQLELLADGWGDPSDRETGFLLPSELRAMAAPLRRLLDVLFQSTPYTQPSMLRGIYFCGDPEAEATPGVPGRRTPTQRSPLFITHLLERKVFPESGLAGPDAELTRGNQRVVKMLQGTLLLCAALAVLIPGLLWALSRSPGEERTAPQPPPAAAQPAEPAPAPKPAQTSKPTPAPKPIQASKPAPAPKPVQVRQPVRSATWDDAPPPRTAWDDAPPPPPTGASTYRRN